MGPEDGSLAVRRGWGAWDARKEPTGIRRVVVVVVNGSGAKTVAKRRVRIVRAASAPLRGHLHAPSERQGQRPYGLHGAGGRGQGHPPRRVPGQRQAALDPEEPAVALRRQGRPLEHRQVRGGPPPPHRHGDRQRGASTAQQHPDGHGRAERVRRREGARPVGAGPDARPSSDAARPAASPGDPIRVNVGLRRNRVHRRGALRQPRPGLPGGLAGRGRRGGRRGLWRPEDRRAGLQDIPTDVYFRPAPSAGVSVSYIDVYGSHVEIRSLTTRGWYVRPGANDVTLRDVTSVGGGTFITSANDVNLLGGTIANANSVDGLQVKMSAVNGHVEPTNLLIDGLFIHDVTRVAPEPSAHTECIQFTAGRNVVIRNSWFTDCSTQGVFFKEGLGGEINNVLVENSWFGKLIGYNTLIFDDGISNMVARYNSFAQAPRLGGGVSTSNLSAYGNAGIMSNGCGEGVVYRYNVWSASKCGSTDLQANPSFINPGALDLRLAANSPAINRGDPGAYPAIDVFGTARPLGGRADAGAHERQ